MEEKRREGMILEFINRYVHACKFSKNGSQPIFAARGTRIWYDFLCLLFKSVFIKTADGADEVFGKIFPLGTGGDAVFRSRKDNSSKDRNSYYKYKRDIKA